MTLPAESNFFLHSCKSEWIMGLYRLKLANIDTSTTAATAATTRTSLISYSIMVYGTYDLSEVPQYNKSHSLRMAT